MNHPLSTYRLQFHKGFNFEDFEKVIPYLHKLGVQTIYASPIFRSLPGSTHGYDTVDPHEINPEIGSLDQFRKLAGKVSGEGMGWLQDIVPNHMAFVPSNPWIHDLLVKGKQSWYASFFDIDWNHPDYQGKLMLPFLGKDFGQAVKNGEIKIQRENGETFLQYFDTRYPAINDDGSDDALALHDKQHYKLVAGSTTDKEINYRRFFTVNTLICLNMQDERVFQQFHSFIKQLYDEGLITGFRIDHIDGLEQPKTYLERLKYITSPQTYVVAEKILEPNEGLSVSWSLKGTTGYDFMAMLTNVQSYCPNQSRIQELYTEFTGMNGDYHQQLHESKRNFLYTFMAGEWDNLFRLLDNIGPRRDRPSDDELKKALGEFMVYCPVYRFYGNELPLDLQEAGAVKGILENISSDEPSLKPACQYLTELLVDKLPEGDMLRMEQRSAFYRRLMQFCGPLMAKGLEDTLMYQQFRLLAHNEVGDTPDACGLMPDEFHKKMKARESHWSHTLNATSTHDTKRGEDARARINVITHLPDQWKELAARAMQLREGPAPDANDAYFIAQTVMGHLPFDGLVDDDLRNRLQAYVEKALRESKRNSSWSAPNLQYEEAVKAYAVKLLGDDEFRNRAQVFLEPGIINSLQQVLLKFMAPGIPDTYQGTENWDLSFVDPDNRRPVDFVNNAATLDEIIKRSTDDNFLDWLWNERNTGQIKLWLTWKLLHHRMDHPTVFSDGEYLPLKVNGKHKDHILAFARRYRKRVIITVIPIHLAVLGITWKTIDWADTEIQIPDGTWGEAKCVLTGKESGLKAGDMFRKLPFALLEMETHANPRGAGVLMHISSLPSPFGIGDMGPEARSFADFLYRSRQSYWQILPLNPTEGGQGNSPYSSTSSRAGNFLFISPELLVRDGLLSMEDFNHLKQKVSDSADYAKAEEIKLALLNKAWINYKSSANHHWNDQFETFKVNEEEWLDDFALFTLLKKKHGGRAWYDWEKSYKFRDKAALIKIAGESEDNLEQTKWIQFVFHRQWEALKTYCNTRHVLMVGDMPFYVSYDSADVWANREVFAIDSEGNRTGLAGVPPDVFSADGQLWGMPVFNWEKLKETGYEWWMQRLRKNMQLYDLTRLDHFRAFHDYWEVPVEAESARFGVWKPGPGPDFFDTVLDRFGAVPFIAEDLGEISGGVDSLRMKYDLPGMKVLQFAFGDDMPVIGHVPHHHQKDFVVYSGTHDNNTVKGWFRTEGEDLRSNLELYLGYPVHEDEVADIFARLTYSSVCNKAILPVQDILGLAEEGRMNKPGNTGVNWGWRLLPGSLHETHEEKLRLWVRIYDRV